MSTTDATTTTTTAAPWTETAAVTEVLIHCFTIFWNHPIRDAAADYDKAYRVTLTHGNTNFAVVADISHVEAKFASGHNLQELEPACAKTCNLIIALNKKALMKACLPLWQAVLNLMGLADDPVVLTGDAMEEKEVIDEECHTGYDLAMSNAHQLKMTLACLFQEWDAARDSLQIMSSHVELELCLASHFFSLPYTLFGGISHFNVAARSRGWKRRKHLRAGRAVQKRASQWIAQLACPDAVPIPAFLEAEQYVATSKKKLSSQEIQHHYDIAIDRCRRAELVHYQAFCEERCATVLAEKNCPQLALPYYQSALEHYTTWGAMAKVTALETLIAKLDASNKEEEGVAPITTTTTCRASLQTTKKESDNNSLQSDTGCSSSKPSTNPSTAQGSSLLGDDDMEEDAMVEKKVDDTLKPRELREDHDASTYCERLVETTA